MKEFDVLCRELEEMDGATYTALLAEKAARVLPALAAVSDSGVDGAAMLATFILGAVAADGKLSEEEYLLLSPMLHVFFGDAVDYETCKEAVKEFRPEARALKDGVDMLVDVLGQLSEDLKDDIVLVCLMICAIDGKVSQKEKRWIKQLVRE